jgi:hypothetical protein
MRPPRHRGGTAPRALDGTLIEHMKRDNDLKALRERDDFKKLLVELEKDFF